VFDERELELLIGGIADIDVEDWKKHTDYRGYTENDEVIQNFWKCIRSWDAEQKSRLLQFATGTSRIPVNGFKDLQGSDGPRRFTIEKAGEPNQLPKSHTWYISQIHTLKMTMWANHNAVSIVLIYQGTRPTKHSTRNSQSPWRKPLVSDRSRRVTVICFRRLERRARRSYRHTFPVPLYKTRRSEWGCRDVVYWETTSMWHFFLLFESAHCHDTYWRCGLRGRLA
jgi:hypothetical protein